MTKLRYFDTESSATLTDIVRSRSASQRDESVFTFVADASDERRDVTYGELDARARAIAERLHDEGLADTRALLLYPTGLDYVAAFLGCLYAGVTAVPAYPPDPSRISRSLPRLMAIVDDAEAAVALTTARYASSLQSLIPDAGPRGRGVESSHLRVLATDDAEAPRTGFALPPVAPDAVAFIQYTSGSTSAPKGVMVSHGNLLHNSALIGHAFGLSADSRGVIWLPLYHDMGLIGGVLQPLVHGFHCTILSPLAFLRWPLRWLNEISRVGEHPVVSGGPSFAYELCARKIVESDLAAVDLSSWKLAFCGAEPINAATLRRFASRFRGCGFDSKAFYPCYGLAEATLIVSGGAREAEPITLSMCRSALGTGRIEPRADADDGAEFVACGRPLLDEHLRIVEPRTLALCADDRVGEIWVASPSVAHGYWRRTVETHDTFNAFLDTGEGPYLRTGDLGFVRDGELFVTGRLKDVIIIRGVNHYPQDVELTAAASHHSLRPGCGAAFSVSHEGEERLVVVHEAKSRDVDLDAVAESMREAIAGNHGLEAHRIVLIRPRTLPKTSSGKIQRNACREAFLSGRLDILFEWRAEQSGAPATPNEPAVCAAGTAAGVGDIRLWLATHIAAAVGCPSDRIDTSRSFQSFGVDSVHGVELAARLEEWLGRPVSSTLTWEHDSIDAAAEQLASAALDDRSIGSDPAAERERPSEFALSHGQQALWFQHQLTPQSVYNIVHAVTLREDLDLARLQRALQTVVERHPSLRTTIVADRGMPRQRTDAQTRAAFEHHDVRACSESELRAALDADAARPFDLEHGPLFRVSVFSRSRDEHIVLVAVHHIIADLWSLSIVASELEAEYAGSPERHDAPPLRQSYASFVEWEQARLAGPRGRELVDYWRQRLSGELPIVDLPSDRPRPPVLTYDGAIAPYRFGLPLTDALKTLARQSDVTLYVLLLTAFKVLLSRYTGIEELIVGSPALGRTEPSLASVVGYFVNPVAIRTNIAEEAEFSEVVAAVRDNVRAGLTHQDYPFSLVTQAVQPRRDASRTPIFQVMFILQRAQMAGTAGLGELALAHPGSRVRLTSLTLESFQLPKTVAPFDLTLMLADTREGLKASVYYNTNLYDADNIGRLLSNYASLLGELAANPLRRVASLSAITAAERRKLLREWNGPISKGAGVSNGIGDERIVDPVDAHAAARPDAVALHFDGSHVTYAELDSRSNQIARYLRAMGIDVEQVVGLHVDRSPEMVIALLGILKSGAAFLPIDTGYPKARLEQLLADAGMAALVTAGELEAGLCPTCPLVRLDVDAGAIARERADALPAVAGADNLAYVIYTSGSTGLPKGVEVQHRGLCNFIRGYARHLSIGADSRFLQFASLAFDAAVAEIFLALTNGGTLCLIDRATTLSNTGLLRSLRDDAVTAAILPPSRLAILRDDDLPALRTLMSAGEPCTPNIVERWSRGRDLFNGYGPTEATVGPTLHHATSTEPCSHSVPIGRPIDGIRVYILGPHQQLLPIGARGEICIAGIGLARGYRQRPDLTAEKFVPDPYAATAGGRMYRTGDLGRYRADGTLQFLGRCDDQVKIRGFRIELGEIEASLERHPAVAAAAAVVVGADADADADKRIVAYVVPKDGRIGAETGDAFSTESSDATSAPLAALLKTDLQQRLPEYMVPSTIVELRTMPMTPNGKIDRKALAAAPPGSASTSAPPRTELERTLAAVWMRVLGVERVGIHDNFFELGGHSLKIAEAQEHLKQVLGEELRITDLFRYPTIAALAGFLTDRQPDQLPLSELQSRADRQRAAAQLRMRPDR